MSRPRAQSKSSAQVHDIEKRQLAEKEREERKAAKDAEAAAAERTRSAQVSEEYQPLPAVDPWLYLSVSFTYKQRASPSAAGDHAANVYALYNMCGSVKMQTTRLKPCAAPVHGARPKLSTWRAINCLLCSARSFEYAHHAAARAHIASAHMQLRAAREAEAAAEAALSPQLAALEAQWELLHGVSGAADVEELLATWQGIAI